MSSYFLRIVRSPVIIDKVFNVYIRNCSLSQPILFSRNLIHTSGFRSQISNKDNEVVVSSSKRQGAVSTSVKETVKEATKTVSYLGVIIVGVGVTAVMLYAILSELFSSKSPNSVYTKAVERCCQDDRIKNALGEPIQAFGEETRRGRRRHASHIVYNKEGVEHIRMLFYLKGSRERATAQVEMIEDENGKYIFRYLFVQLDISRRVIILEDNRATPETPTPLASPDDFYNYSSPLTS